MTCANTAQHTSDARGEPRRSRRGRAPGMPHRAQRENAGAGNGRREKPPGESRVGEKPPPSKIRRIANAGASAQSTNIDLGRRAARQTSAMGFQLRSKSHRAQTRISSPVETSIGNSAAAWRKKESPSHLGLLLLPPGACRPFG